LTHYISVVNRAIPDIFAAIDSPPKCLQGPENRWSTFESASTAEGQTCLIARYTTLIVRGAMFDSLCLGR